MDAMMTLSMPGYGASATLTAINERFATVGLSITREEAMMLAKRRVESLEEAERVEFGEPAIFSIAGAIAGSPHLDQSNVANVLAELQDAFYAVRNELPVDVPDVEIVEALRGCFDQWGDATEVIALPASDVMAFSTEYVRAMELDKADVYRIIDDDGREYTFNPVEWEYDERAEGWDGERWADDWDD